MGLFIDKEIAEDEVAKIRSVCTRSLIHARDSSGKDADIIMSANKLVETVSVMQLVQKA